MRTFWASLAQAAALMLLLWPAESYTSPSWAGDSPVEERDPEVPEFDLTVPEIETPPSNYKPIKFFYPDTLLGTLMRDYCNRNIIAGYQFACDPESKKCRCYSTKQVAPDSILWQDQDKLKFKHTLLGVPYKLRSQLMKYNILSMRNLNRRQNLKYINFNFEADDGTDVPESKVLEILEAYKSAPMRGQTNTKVRDVLDAYMHDPVCTLRSSVYYVKGTPPPKSHEGAKAYDLFYQQMDAMKFAAKTYDQRGHSDEGVSKGQGPKAPSFLGLMARERYNGNLRRRKAGRPRNQENQTIMEDNYAIDIGAISNVPENDTANAELYKRYARGEEDSPQPDEVGKGRRSRASTVNPDGHTDRQYDRIDRCSLYNVLKERHGIELGTMECGSRVSSRCDRTPDGLFCHPFVQTRFYAPLKQEFYLTIEHFTFSAAFGVYLGPEKVLCGSQMSIENGLHYMYNPETSGLPILEEYTVENQRFFRVGPFSAVDKPGKYKICGCASNHGVDDVKTCLHFSEYTRVMGQVVFAKGSEEPTVSTIELGSSKKFSFRDTIALLVDTESNFVNCQTLFDAYHVNWFMPALQKLPNYGRYIRVFEADDKDSIEIDFPKVGKYRLCLINKSTMDVVEHNDSFVVKGIRDNASAVIYRNASGQLTGSSLIFEHYDYEHLTAESFFLADSETDCSAKTVGRWSGALHPYYIYKIDPSMLRWVVRDLQIDLGESAPRLAYAICVEYPDSPKAVRIGSARVQNHFDLDERFLINTSYHMKSAPDYIYNYQLGRNSEFIFTLLTSLSFSDNVQYKDFRETFYANDDYFYGILGNSRSLMLHCRVYSERDTIMLWLMADEDPTLYPLFTVLYLRPRAVAIGKSGDKLYMYILNDTKLSKVLLTDLYRPITFDKLVRTVSHNGNIRYMEVIHLSKKSVILAINVLESCVIVYDDDLVERSRFCNSGTVQFLTPGGISCVKDTNAEGYTSCFVASSISNELLHLSFCHQGYAIKILSRYKSGTVVDDLDPKMGSIVSLFATTYEHDKKKDVGIFALREDGEHGGLYRTVTGSDSISFVSPLTNVGDGAFMRAIYPVFNSDTNRSAMVLCEVYPKEAIDSSVEIDKMFERTKDDGSSSFRLTWAPYDELTHVPELIYKVDPYMTIGKTYEFTPVLGPGSDRFPQVAEWSLDTTQIVDKTTFGEVVKISDTGTLTFKSKRPYSARFDVVRRLLWSTSTATIEIDFLCPDGTYFNGKACVECPMGTYNAAKYIQEDRSLIASCKSCPRFETTASLGASSVDDCHCIYGYAASGESSGGMRCQPCSGATYKSMFELLLDDGRQCILGGCILPLLPRVLPKSQQEFGWWLSTV
ncbi:kringle domain-containing protein [Babesia ovata]|uniref:Kringle domain-containing protein n=1 Tax=Babesia ovata TaxID=189622 RepID=A0A2H6KHV5_9APIC|nr:kringle domain-containing protein [Babesia ovata]GBE62576.1 kringle domain-containing protein [Babesia ovata]